MLKPEYNLELTHLALVLYIYGQNCISLYSSHIGLFRGDVYMARAILANTAEIASAPSKTRMDVEEPDITEKFEELKFSKRLTKTSYQFSKDSAILNYLLSLSEKQLDEIQQTSDAIGESKKELEKVLVSQEDEEMYEEMKKKKPTRS